MHDRNLMVVLGKKPRDPRADEAGPAEHKDAHGGS
jgi:hypothetical protein